jgi:hypothetical protein
VKSCKRAWQDNQLIQQDCIRQLEPTKVSFYSTVSSELKTTTVLGCVFACYTTTPQVGAWTSGTRVSGCPARTLLLVAGLLRFFQLLCMLGGVDVRIVLLLVAERQTAHVALQYETTCIAASSFARFASLRNITQTFLKWCVHV